jgi:hypothetical protein
MRIIEILYVPAAIRRQFSDGVSAGNDAAPEILWRANTSGETTGHPDYRDLIRGVA